VEEIFSLVGRDKLDIDILSDDFLANFANMMHKNITVELL
jgi:hypothetical protein